MKVTIFYTALAVALVFLQGRTQAAEVTYFFANNAATPASAFDFETNTGMFTDASVGSSNGLTIDFQAFVGGTATAADLLNATGTSFGVNADGSGDESALLDSAEGQESIVLSFSGPSTISSVKFRSLTVSSWTRTGPGADSGEIVFAADPDLSLGFGTTSFTGTDELLGSSFEVFTLAGNGFGIASLTLDVTAVPEPSSFALLFVAAGGVMVRRRRR